MKSHLEHYEEAFGQLWANGLQKHVPEPMVGGVVRYILNGIKPGHFLSALMAGDFVEMCRRGDNVNLDNLKNYGAFLCNYAPMGSYGSSAAFEAWRGQGGYIGSQTEEGEAS